MSGNSPSTTCRSVRHTPQALTLIRTSPAPGSGSGRSCIVRAAPGAVRTMACIANFLTVQHGQFRARPQSRFDLAHVANPAAGSRCDGWTLDGDVVYSDSRRAGDGGAPVQDRGRSVGIGCFVGQETALENVARAGRPHWTPGGTVARAARHARLQPRLRELLALFGPRTPRQSRSGGGRSLDGGVERPPPHRAIQSAWR